MNLCSSLIILLFISSLRSEALQGKWMIMAVKKIRCCNFSLFTMSFQRRYLSLSQKFVLKLVYSTKFLQQYLWTIISQRILYKLNFLLCENSINSGNISRENSSIFTWNELKVFLGYLSLHSLQRNRQSLWICSVLCSFHNKSLCSKLRFWKDDCSKVQNICKKCKNKVALLSIVHWRYLHRIM